MERQLASIQKIKSVESIEGADNIEKVSVLGWHCVAKKGEFKVGDRCIYCEIDSVLPEKPEFEFLRKNNFRIRTIKLRGQISQGICFPLDIIVSDKRLSYLEGADVTEELGVIKYEPKLPGHLGGIAKGFRPSYIPKTDETRIQSCPDVLIRHFGDSCYYTEKMDGTSVSVWNKDGYKGISSRKLELKEDDTSAYWIAVKRLEMLKRLDQIKFNVCVQGELVGPGIQGNKYRLKETDIFLFNIFNIDEQRYLNFDEMVDVSMEMGLKTVPILGKVDFKFSSVDDIVEFAKGKSMINPEIMREGIVVRPLQEKTDEELGRFSFKVVNADFLIKFGE